MNEIKGMEKLNKAITNTLKPFGISEARLTDEYAYMFTDESVNFKITEDTIGDRMFAEFIEERFDYKVRFPFVVSILHEIGHHKTNDDIDGSVYDFCEKEKIKLTEDMEKAKTEEEIRKLQYRYFNLPDEIVATAWAVNYCKEHPKKVETLWKKMETALMDFYKENGVLDEIEGEVS